MACKTGYTLFKVDFSKGQATNFNQFVACIHPPLSSNKIGVPLLDFVFRGGDGDTQVTIWRRTHHSWQSLRLLYRVDPHILLSVNKTGKNYYPAHLSARSSRCCPIASTLYPSRLAHAYKRPRFIREQKLHIDSQTVSRAACCMIPVRKKISNRIYCFMGTIASTQDGGTCLVSSVFFLHFKFCVFSLS